MEIAFSNLHALVLQSVSLLQVLLRGWEPLLALTERAAAVASLWRLRALISLHISLLSDRNALNVGTLFLALGPFQKNLNAGFFFDLNV